MPPAMYDNVKLTINWDDGRISYFAVKFETDRSLLLENLNPDKATVTLTKNLKLGTAQYQLLSFKII